MPRTVSPSRFQYHHPIHFVRLFTPLSPVGQDGRWVPRIRWDHLPWKIRSSTNSGWQAHWYLNHSLHLISLKFHQFYQNSGPGHPSPPRSLMWHFTAVYSNECSHQWEHRYHCNHWRVADSSWLGRCSWRLTGIWIPKRCSHYKTGPGSSLKCYQAE